MPKVYQEIDVDIDDFLENCSSMELKEIYTALKDDYKEYEKDESIRSDGERNFYYHLQVLKDSWLSMTKEDAQIIEILSKKYGAV